MLWTEAEVAASATAELRNRDDLRVSRPPEAATWAAAADAPPPTATPPEADPPPTRLLAVLLPVLRLLVLPHVSWYLVL